MASLGEVLALARGGGPQAPAAIDAIGAHRRAVAAALLSSNDGEQTLAQRVGEVAELAASAFPWDPTAEDFELSRAILEQWSRGPTLPISVLMAAMALAPAHHFPEPIRLALMPSWLRVPYARFLLGSPPIFLHVGEADRYAGHCTRAMEIVKSAVLDEHLPEAVDLARVVCEINSVMIYFNEQSLKGYFRNKALIFEWLLLKQGNQLGHSFPLLKNVAKKIGVLHRSLAPGTETYYLLAHLEGRDADASDVTLYLFDAAPSVLSDAFRPWINNIVQLPSDLAGAVARIREDRLDLCLITNNIAWGLPLETAMAAHRLAKIQVVGGASPVTSGLSNADLFLSSEMNDPSPAAQDDYEEGLARVSGGAGYFAFSHDRDPQTITCSRVTMGMPSDGILYFSGANYFKITPEVLATWAEILALTPGSSLILMPFNQNWQNDYPVAAFLRRLTRVLSTFGVSPDRVKPLARVATRADLHAVMSVTDIYLDSFPFPGSCSLIDPLIVGLPVVARGGRTFRTGVAEALLRNEGLESTICADRDAYIARAVRLAKDAAFRQDEREQVLRANTPALACLETKPYAEKFAAFCLDSIAASHQHVDGLSESRDLQLIVADAAKLALQNPPPALRQLTDKDIVVQLLVPYVETLSKTGKAAGRIVDVGACMGVLSTPFLRAGFQVDMFEPDPDCAAQLTAITREFPAIATHHATAIVWEPVQSVSFNKRSVGLSGLGESPFGQSETRITVPATTLRQHLNERPSGVDVIKIDAEGSDFSILESIDFANAAPKVVMVEFGADFPDQTSAEVRNVLSRMEAAGYGAVIFEYSKMSGFAVKGWDYELVDLSLDAERLGQRGDGFGNILFFRRSDGVFLACLASWLEFYVPAQQRPAFLAMSGTARDCELGVDPGLSNRPTRRVRAAVVQDGPHSH